MTERARLEAPGHVWPVEGVVSIGRWDARVGADPEVDLTELDPKRSVSRRHATLEAGLSGAVLRDAGSGNGTSVAGRQLRPGEATKLADGVLVQLGDVVLVFRAAVDPETEPAVLERESDMPGGIDPPAGDPQGTLMAGRHRLVEPEPVPKSRRKKRRPRGGQ